MRALLVLLFVAGCPAFDARQDKGGVGSGSGSNGVYAECSIAMECELAGAKCCDCPTYAAPINDPAVRACADVQCPTPMCPANVRADCVDGKCTVACVPSSCDQSCAYGFQIDPTGCLECACAGPADAAFCNVDTDCVRVAADCCGCEHGGMDTAVPAAQAAGYEAALMCPQNPTCPDPPSCAPEVVPRCIAGSCVLAPPTPPGACGRSDLPTCPPGTSCTINATDDATQQGVGVCM